MTLNTAVNSRSRRLACVTVLVLMAAGLAALVWAAFTPSKARVVYNASDSVPIGWYRITPLDTDANAIPVDSIVLVNLPDAVAVLADQRGYLPLDVPLLKRVGAVAPQHCAHANSTTQRAPGSERSLRPLQCNAHCL